MYHLTARANTDSQKEKVVERLLNVWKSNPSMRLSQLIGNVYPCGSLPDVPEMKAIINGDLKPIEHKDSYHVEDFTFINELEEFYKGLNEAR